MWNLVSRTAVLVLTAALVAGCGFLRPQEQRDPWRTEAEERCIAQRLVKETAWIARRSELRGEGVCGATKPYRVSAFAEGEVGLSQIVDFSCPMVPAVERWIAETVRPAAVAVYGVELVEIETAGTYSCRRVLRRSSGPWSEHAFANAFDVRGFKLADGRRITVSRGWRGEEPDQAFLRTVHAGACDVFSTVLGPGSDGAHEDHFHVDLARHDPTGRRRVCRPTPQTPAVAGTAAPVLTGSVRTPWPRVPGAEPARPAAP